MNEFEKSLVELLGERNLKKIQSHQIGIVGAGGLGSNCALNLVRSGFKSLIIADFDKIEYSNLNRQFYTYNQVGNSKVKKIKKNLKNINPAIELEMINQEINKKNIRNIFANCDIIVEAVDQVNVKKMIVETYMNTDKFLVSASGLAGWGDSDLLKTRKINDTFYMVGDFATEISPDQPPLSPRVNIAAAKQADIILDYVMNTALEN